MNPVYRFLAVALLLTSFAAEALPQCKPLNLEGDFQNAQILTNNNLFSGNFYEPFDFLAGRLFDIFCSSFYPSNNHRLSKYLSFSIDYSNYAYVTNPQNFQRQNDPQIIAQIPPEMQSGPQSFIQYGITGQQFVDNIKRFNQGKPEREQYKYLYYLTHFNGSGQSGRFILYKKTANYDMWFNLFTTGSNPLSGEVRIGNPDIIENRQISSGVLMVDASPKQAMDEQSRTYWQRRTHVVDRNIDYREGRVVFEVKERNQTCSQCHTKGPNAIYPSFASTFKPWSNASPKDFNQIIQSYNRTSNGENIEHQLTYPLVRNGQTIDLETEFKSWTKTANPPEFFASTDSLYQNGRIQTSCAFCHTRTTHDTPQLTLYPGVQHGALAEIAYLRHLRMAFMSSSMRPGVDLATFENSLLSFDSLEDKTQNLLADLSLQGEHFIHRIFYDSPEKTHLLFRKLSWLNTIFEFTIRSTPVTPGQFDRDMLFGTFDHAVATGYVSLITQQPNLFRPLTLAQKALLSDILNESQRLQIEALATWAENDLKTMISNYFEQLNQWLYQSSN